MLLWPGPKAVPSGAESGFTEAQTAGRAKVVAGFLPLHRGIFMFSENAVEPQGLRGPALCLQGGHGQRAQALPRAVGLFTAELWLKPRAMGTSWGPFP